MTSSDFLELLRQKYGNPARRDVPSADYLSVHHDQEAALGVVGFDPQSFFDSFLSRTAVDIAELLIGPFRDEIPRIVSVGTCDNMEVNAFICRHPSARVYAVLVNRGFISVYNHYSKLIAAANFPGDVLFYQGISLAGLGPRTFSQAAQRMLAEYRDGHEVVGPELKLKLKSHAHSRTEFVLHNIYWLVVGHELGHYVNGDLEDLHSLVEVPGMAAAVRVASTGSHDREFRADEFAFDALLRRVARDEPKFPARRLLDLSVTLFFNLMREISDRGSASHPPSSERLLRIVHTFFGERARAIMQASFSDLSKIEHFHREVGDRTVSQILDLRRGRFFR